MGGFIDYTDRYSEAVVELELLMDDPKIIAHFKVLLLLLLLLLTKLLFCLL